MHVYYHDKKIRTQVNIRRDQSCSRSSDSQKPRPGMCQPLCPPRHPHYTNTPPSHWVSNSLCRALERWPVRLSMSSQTTHPAGYNHWLLRTTSEESTMPAYSTMSCPVFYTTITANVKTVNVKSICKLYEMHVQWNMGISKAYLLQQTTYLPFK